MPDPEHSVKVQFYGICTHMAPQARATEPAHWGHRVVLVNASDPARWHHVPELGNVGAHMATLLIRREDLIAEAQARPWFPITYEDAVSVEWKLDGVTISFADAVPTIPEPVAGDCIPHLRDRCDDLPAAGPATFERNPQWTACFFDFPASVLAGKSINQGAAVGELTVGTSHEPMLQITPFAENEEPLSFRIRNGAQITVANIPDDHDRDKDEDFYLHFLTASVFPAGMSTPPAELPRCPEIETNNRPRNLGDFTGPGCSNSNYP
jgi:hypothetical protein